jgi:hypothetical protein
MRLARAALFAATIATPAFANATIPAQFRGLWGSAGDRCGAADDKARLEASADALTFYYDAGPVTSVIRHDARHISVAAKLSTIVHIDIDIIRIERLDLELSDSADALTVTYDDGTRLTHSHCANVAN